MYDIVSGKTYLSTQYFELPRVGRPVTLALSMIIAIGQYSTEFQYARFPLARAQERYGWSSFH